MFSIGGKNPLIKIKKNKEHYFRNHRWQLLTLLEKLSGVWPYQSTIQQYSLQLIHFLVLMSIFSAMGNKLGDLKGVDSTRFIECMLLMMFVFALNTKLVAASLYKRDRKKIFERIAEHFKVITDEEEAEILKQAADQGFSYTIIFFCLIMILVSTFDCLPIIRAFCNHYFDNQELDMELPLPMDYGINHRKYWYIIVIDYSMFVYSGILVDFSFDLSFILQIYHIEALFKIVGLRLNKATELVNELGEEALDDAYSLISSAIDLHSECLEVVGLIENAYSMSWFFILLMNSAGLGACIHVISSKLEDPIDTIRYSSPFVLVLIHFYIIFSQGQTIIDSSSSISEACYSCKWYCLPVKSRRLLVAMMIRTTLPCEITGAHFFPLSMEVYSKMMKAGLSYYTVFQA